MQENNVCEQEIEIELKKCVTQEALDANSTETALQF